MKMRARVAICALLSVFATFGLAACSPVPVEIVDGAAELEELEMGKPADLSLLPAIEQQEISAAIARADRNRKGLLVVRLGRRGVAVRLTQVGHGLRIGSALDLASVPDENLDWYKETFRKTFNVAVVENSLKWPSVEPEEGVRRYERFEETLEFTEQIGVPLKGHTLLWGSSVPDWLKERFPSAALDPDEETELRTLVRGHILDVVQRYGDRIDTWDVVNESTAFTAQWFIARLGRGIVADAFRWAREELGDGDTLILNEWLGEQPKTGIPTPADVALALSDLEAAGVQVDVMGLQAHFVPALAHFGIPVEDDERIPIDVHGRTLDAVADNGLPIYISEFSAIRPTGDPELRAAQTEGLLQLYFGHPAVEEIMFWGFWEGKHFLSRTYENPTLWSEPRELSRQGEVVLSLLNDRWRTRADLVTGPAGWTVVQAFHGDYVAEWEICGEIFHARFSLEPSDRPVVVDLTASVRDACSKRGAQWHDRVRWLEWDDGAPG